MRKLLILLFCLTLAGYADARLVLTGVVTDKQDTKPVEGANVELLRLPDSTSIESIKSSSEGMFMLYKADTLSTYCLRCPSFDLPGFHPSCAPQILRHDQ